MSGLLSMKLRYVIKVTHYKKLKICQKYELDSTDCISLDRNLRKVLHSLKKIRKIIRDKNKIG
jgi:hypothetical protein